jgi:cytochrome b subunit of formate dehydrogenase
MQFLIALLLFAGFAQAESGFDPENCMGCHGQVWFAVSDSSGVSNFHIDESAYRQSVHGRFACRQCHTDVDQVPHSYPVQKVNCSVACHVVDPYTGEDFSHKKMDFEVKESVHGVNGASNYDHLKPECKDCHTNSVYWQELPPDMERAKQKCMACHESYNELDQDFQHLALHLSEDQYWRQQQTFQACVRCHTQNELVSDSLETMLINQTMVSSFLESFHGRGFSFGDARSPVCADCHGHHKIYSHRDKRSSIHPSNIRETCGTTNCHDGATVAFATAGSMHNLYQGYKVQILFWVKQIYIWMIIVVLGGMMLHNLLDFSNWFRRRNKAERKEDMEHKKAGRRFVRMNKAERVSHIVMFVSFTMLALTGALLWIPADYFGTLTRWEYFMPFRAWSHRVFAILITLISVYHLAYSLFTKRGRVLLVEMLPRPSDIKLVFQNIAWMLGRREHPPAHRFFNYAEKAEYWAFAWGSLVMTATGVILWFEHLGSKFIVDLARLVHSLEAILAVAAIVVWHFWNVHWKPGRWPMSTVWIDGDMDEHDIEEEHGAMLAEDAAEQFHPELMQHKEIVERRSLRKRDIFARGLGWSFLVLTLVTCAVMIWSFQQYLGASGTDRVPKDLVNVSRPLSDHDAVMADPSYSLMVAHEDVDWRHERFHNANPVTHVDANVRETECNVCHAALPHVEDRKDRAYLNLHSRFMTCESCHADRSRIDAGQYRWVDLRKEKKGEPDTPFHLLSEPKNIGEDNYSSYIALVLAGNPLFDDRTSPRALEFENSPVVMNQSRMNELKDRFHDRINGNAENALSCGDCHTKEGEGVVDFKKLGFDEDRIRELRTLSRAHSVTDYDVFYLPAPY